MSERQNQSVTLDGLTVDSLPRFVADLQGRVADLEAACRELLAAYTEEELESGFPFNFRLRAAHRALCSLLGEPTEPNNALPDRTERGSE